MGWVEFGFNPDILKGARSKVLDHLRWWSALAVVLAHTRNLFFPDYSDLVQVGLFTKAFYFLTLFGTQAVVVFFVVSGLLIGGKVISGVRSGGFCFSKYLLDRFVRLYVVLIPAVILSVVLAASVSGGLCADSLWTIVGNLLFLQNIIFEPLCNNHPLWSLSNEAFYYVLAGVVGYIFVWRDLRSFLFLFFLLCFVVWFSGYSPVSIIGASHLWLLGLVPWFVRIRVPSIWFGGVFLVVVCLSRVHFFGNDYLDKFAIAASLSLALCSDVRWCVPWDSWASKFSYSMYLIHMPIAQAIYFLFGRLDPDSASSYFLFLFVVMIVAGFSWVFWYLFESRTSMVRVWLGGRLGLR